MCEAYGQMNKKQPAFPGYTEESEELLERSALTMIRGLAKTRRQIMCQQLLNLCQPRRDPRERPMIRVGTAAALPPAAAAREEETVLAAEEWDPGESDEEWDQGHSWLPPPPTT